MTNEYKNSELTFSAFQNLANNTDHLINDAQSINSKRFGLFGQVGGLLTLVKKTRRERLRQAPISAMEEEAGDILWYLSALSSSLNIALSEVALKAIDKLQDELKLKYEHHDAASLTFKEFDGLISLAKNTLPKELDPLLNRLGLAAGHVMQDNNPRQQDILTTKPVDVLANVLVALTMVIGHKELTFVKIANLNVEKIQFRWRPENSEYIELLDPASPKHERFPEKFAVSLIQRETADGVHVYQQIAGVNIGDRLTDNKNEPDGYRFHDVFHLAYAAHLGWSPVIRSLLKVKRKYDSRIDENEDGARARIIEEGIATWIFNHANLPENKLYEGIKPGELAYSILKQVHEMVRGYEVEKCPMWQWEFAILDGFKIFRQLKANPPGGRVIVDTKQHTISYEAFNNGDI